MCSACSPKPASPSRSFRSRESGTPTIANLWARFGRDAPNFVFAGHTDVVPPGDATRWRFPPFSATLAEGALWGRGVADMKGGVAAALAAALRFVARGAFKGSISFLLTGDEEGPAVNGTVKLLDWARARGERFDACLLGEPTSQAALGDTIKHGRRGSLNGRLTLDRQAGPRRLSAARRQSDPRARADRSKRCRRRRSIPARPISTPPISRSSASTSAIRRPTSFPAKFASSSTCASTTAGRRRRSPPRSSGASPRRRRARATRWPSIRPTPSRS